MKKRIGLFIGGVALLLASTASASPLAVCGSVGSAGNGSVAFTASSSGSAGSAITSGGIGIITCSGVMVPTGQTLAGISVEVTDDAQQSRGTNSQITWTWTYSGEPLTPAPIATNQENGNAASEFNSCTGTGTLQCNTVSNFSTVASYSGGMTTGNFVFDVSPTTTGVGGAGLGPTGSDSAQVLIGFNYATAPAASAPEPTTLWLLGSGLMSLGVFIRRKRQS